MKRTGRRRVTKGNVVAGVVALLAFGAVVSAPFWLIKAGQAVNSQHAKTAYRGANHTGQVVHDGTMSFVVDSVHCGVPAIGASKPAHGQFCVFKLTVANEGAQPARFDAISQRAYGSKGGFYVPDANADAASNKASDTLPDVGDPTHQDEADLKPAVAAALEPGTSRNVQVVFDLPVNVKLTQVDLHASEYTRGVMVVL
jgi:hypothetical protein